VGAGGAATVVEVEVVVTTAEAVDVSGATAPVATVVSEDAAGCGSVVAAKAGTATAAVAIAAPAAQHYALAKRALQKGKHVFVEKPLSLKLDQAKELCALAEQSDRRLMVGHLLQYHPVFLRLKELVREGRIGRLQ
jgi:predicted dehydrogenase